ncbi:MAG: CDGSH iron-sulfur domain-containing protein [Deltaproteobacteria bacterium]|nr:MAG: CDGSH iron-sulfur domain-containing protein [Deltaproteobacteria bacterium]
MTSKKNGDMPIRMTLDPGVYYRCTCGRSEHLPFCDESHSGTGSHPIRFELSERQTVYLCACGRSKQQPFCDGGCGFQPPCGANPDKGVDPG